MKNLKQISLQSFLSKLILIATLCLIQTSCKKEELVAKEITYTLSGNFDKNVMVKYTTTEGTIANTEELVNLPWQKIVTPNAENASVGLIVLGNGGLPDTEIIAKIFVNGQEEKAVTTKADEKGHIAIHINHLFD